MNSLLRIFVALAICHVSINAQKCDIDLVKEGEGYKFKMDNVCKCMGYADAIPGATMEDVNVQIVNGSLVLNNASEICRKIGFENKAPVAGSDPEGHNSTSSTSTTTSTTAPAPAPVTRNNDTGVNETSTRTAGSLSIEHKGTSTTTIVLILFFSLFFGCLFAWVSKIVYNRYKSKEYELPPDQQEMETRPRSIREDTRIDTN